MSQNIKTCVVRQGHNYGLYTLHGTGVKFSLTPPPRYGTPRGVNHNVFIVMVCPRGANHNDKCVMINPPLLLLTPPFVMDYQYCNIE